jgi:hypothetical protein
MRMMISNPDALPSKHKLLLALAVIFHFLLLTWTIVSFIPFCCASTLDSSRSLGKGFFWLFVLTGWLATFPLSFFSAIGKLLGVTSFFLVCCIAVIKYGLGMTALEPLLFLVFGFAVAFVY